MHAQKYHQAIQKDGLLPPGSLVHIGTERTEKTRITVVDYAEDHFEEREIRDPPTSGPLLRQVDRHVDRCRRDPRAPCH